MKLNLTAPCHFGLEKTLAFEVRRAGGEDVQVTDGRVNFTGTPQVLVRANLTCSVAERIGVVLAKFKAQTFDDVFDNVKRLSLGDFMPSDAAFPVVKGQSVSSKLTSIPALQRTIKKALAEAMGGFATETGALYPVRFFLHKDEMTVFLDSSGEGLHKRGYREKAGTAPIKETLAAGIVDVAKVRENDIIVDPFCGSGTLLIEAAFKALAFPPGLNRRFAAESWDSIPQELWAEARAARPEPAQAAQFRAYGYDSDPEAVRLTLENARKAGVEKYIHAQQRDIKDFEFPAEQCKVITNPPYAERMLEKADTERIYRIMGEKWRAATADFSANNHKLFLITSDEKFEEHFGQKAAKNRKLYNGMLMCRLYMYG
jgi:putative N6-adenine-specific DNA methylase